MTVSTTSSSQSSAASIPVPSSTNSEPPGSLDQLLAADAGETALLTFSDNVKRHVDFTNNPDDVIHALRMLRKEGEDAQAWMPCIRR